ncbi:glutathione S-transferase family protein [Methyloligella sp. 2.7D]|uniref:glutathione S-transferase family protein n=1 Tax=unclassified Methyloligella TaxID=2625955 RepID=UPI00157DE39A|nr:glutathione S-transferase family protein [Methyloligella sp. GL2]QKP78581.1 glutathione S-transferase family protein [Methyloligella sp. GL2]
MAVEAYRLVIGDKNYSSWSLRPWLAMAHFGISFTEEKVVLRQGHATKQSILRHSPSGKVPCLIAGEILVWDSLAILEFLAERYPQEPFWPKDEAARAEARAVSAEMHSGFQALRNDMPMDIVSRLPQPEISEALEHNIRRVTAIWNAARQRYQADGAFLFGGFSIADAMYAPVVTRFKTFGVDLRRYGDEDGLAASYCETVLAMPEMQAWEEGAAAEMAERAAS